jgi:uncharacterized membrane protein (UPF0136 family)
MTLGVMAAIVYGSLAIVGGIVGYIQAKSKISLVAGCGCGLLVVVSAILQLQGQAWGLVAATGVTIVLLLAFVMRWVKTRKFMPAGLMFVVGIPTLGLMISQLVETYFA